MAAYAALKRRSSTVPHKRSRTSTIENAEVWRWETNQGTLARALCRCEGIL
jgi:hypothetical protein